MAERQRLGPVGAAGMALPGECGWQRAVAEMAFPDGESSLGTLLEAQIHAGGCGSVQGCNGTGTGGVPWEPRWTRLGSVSPHPTVMPLQDIWRISHFCFNPSGEDKVGFAAWRSGGRGPGPDLAAGGAGGLLLNVTSSCADTRGPGA